MELSCLAVKDSNTDLTELLSGHQINTHETLSTIRKCYINVKSSPVAPPGANLYLLQKTCEKLNLGES